nr:immunoglobulin heavy chain junction region [Mus musculus]
AVYYCARSPYYSNGVG